MHFNDEEIDSLNLESVTDFNKLITKYFCGRKTECNLNSQEEKMVWNSLDCIKKNGLTFEQLNEVLLLMNQNRVDEDFFAVYFKKDLISLQELKEGITEFRGYGMLSFGNFRFAFRDLIYKKKDEIEKATSPFCKDSKKLEDSFKKRAPKILDINTIDRDFVYFVGEFSGRKLNAEAKFLKKEMVDAKERKDELKFRELLKIKDEFEKRKKDIKDTEKQALGNADVYLTWDCIDVYVATSMRNKWEYEETYDFIRDVFNDANLQSLKLRYFDPTQSKCSNPRDKGLIEGLMLKRALCAIYMAQEGDTMGKDSELAATLSQSKPVIAYIPDYDVSKYTKQIRTYPLDFFKARLQILDAEGTLNDSKCASRLRKIDRDFQELIDGFLEQLEQFRDKEPYTLNETEQKFKSQFKEFDKLCNVVSTAECFNYDKRAKILMGLHPLCMQVNLDSGVTSGVLVVRKPSDCALLLFRLLTNQMNFTIKKERKGTILEEEVSKCAYRVVTDNEKLTNCFWNFFRKT